jgi:hypothetical protein
MGRYGGCGESGDESEVGGAEYGCAHQERGVPELRRSREEFEFPELQCHEVRHQGDRHQEFPVEGPDLGFDDVSCADHVPARRHDHGAAAGGAQGRQQR